MSLYLDQCKAAGGEVYAFGAKFDRNLHKPIDTEFGNLDGLHGIHDIHLNQGNVGPHAGDNGVFHDGGLILAFPDRYVGLFLGFQTQRIPTDTAGNAAPGAKPIGEIIAHGPGPIPAEPSTVYIERALINPSGDDTGQEIVVLASLSTATQALTGWRLLDKNARVTPINISLGPGQSVAVALDGAGVQLGNQGGNLILEDETIVAGRRGDLHRSGRWRREPVRPVPALNQYARAASNPRRRSQRCGCASVSTSHRSEDASRLDQFGSRNSAIAAFPRGGPWHSF